MGAVIAGNPKCVSAIGGRNDEGAQALAVIVEARVRVGFEIRKSLCVNGRGIVGPVRVEGGIGQWGERVACAEIEIGPQFAIDAKDWGRRGRAGCIKFDFGDVAPRRVGAEITNIAKGVRHRDGLGGHHGIRRSGGDREEIDCVAEVGGICALKFAAEHSSGVSVARTEVNLRYGPADAGAKI